MRTERQEFDAFFSYNRDDREDVEKIAAMLEARGVAVWLDTSQIPPGRWFIDGIQKGILKARSIVLFLGRSGLGRFQVMELRSAVNQGLERGIPVIPVLLPNGAFPEGLLFLREANWVQMTSLDDEKGIDHLEWGITGRKPVIDPERLRALEVRIQGAARQISQLRRFSWGALFVMGLMGACLI
ncbi:MAG: toll/interleukin-1 receptor domain-containing protein [Isosphaeraceae bacterium]